MPFTFAHPAAVLPLRRRWLVFSALVVGSMAPDFEYFFGLTRLTSHSMPGIVTFTFPVALAVLLLFHNVVKWPLISLLPRGLQERVIAPARTFRWFPLSRLVLILISLAIGIATHLLWDGITHNGGWAVTHSVWLHRMVAIPWHHPLPLYFVLQLASTVLGMAAIVVAFAAWYRRATRADVPLRPQFSPAVKWAILGIMTATAVALGILNGAEWYGPLLMGASHRMRFVVGFAVTTTMVGTVELFGFSIIWRAFMAHNMKQGRVSASFDR